jgi:hypothetical protein
MDTLERASVTDVERRALERLVGLLRTELCPPTFSVSGSTVRVHAESGRPTIPTST